ncbi:hypothetical protein OG949_41280 (plasmid) [Streptomyces scopuliridis]|uniref:hypothetical protein n=1 Tax=Streptomyces scopuliridis TaxID=452529 RepID=UPI002DD80C7F|nr:hypothetical protein [Streptomyces scopuliridis]WSB39176.1 hypothetical protein OG949_41280 [Streptomyces scopuliridis]
MFWCDVCKCAYPHGPEGPSTALEAHAAAQHGGDSPDDDGVRTITGRQVVITFLALVILAWAGRYIDFDLM